MTMAQTMANSVPFRDVLRQIQTTLSTWEEAVDRAKKPRSRYIATIGWKGMAALLQYNISLRTARLGATLLESSLDNRQDGLMFGLTKRPMFESYTRGMWLECVADEDFAENFLSRSPGDAERDWTTLASRRNSPGLAKMWSDLNKRKIMKDTVRWMKGKKDWWNDSTHMAARSAWMGWSNEYGAVIHNDEQVRGDLVALLEIGAQCAGHMHTLSQGRGESEQERVIDDEKQRLRRLLSA